MAKIDWVFQNENGTNLNRYIATNVATGEKITFDLLRGGNISIVGTPLNAKNLNSLITAINENYDEFTTLNTKVTNIGKQVATNVSNITSMSTALSNQNDRISANANNIRNNSYNIDTNATNISDLQKSVENLNDTIIEVQQSEGVINLGELSENPYSATNSTLDGLIKSGIYYFTRKKTPYLMLMRYNKEYDWQQVIYLISNNGSTFVFIRRKDISGVSYTQREQLTTTKYVDDKISNSVKGYVHNIVVGDSTYTNEATGKYFFTLTTNSSTPFTNGEQLATYINEVGSITTPANGIYMHFKNPSDSKPTLYHVCAVKIRGTYISGGILPQVINPDSETKMFEGYSFDFKYIDSDNITDIVVPF